MALNISNFATDQDDLVTQSQIKGLSSPAPYIKIPSGDTLFQCMQGWYTAKANAATTPAVIAYIGDSIVGGYTLTEGIRNGYPWRIRQLFQAAGTNWYGDAYSAAPYMWSTQQIATTQFFTPGLFVSPHQLDAGLQRVTYESTNTTNYLETLNVPAGAVECIIVGLAYQAGTWKYSVDGGVDQTVNVTPTTGGTQPQNAAFYKTTIALSGSNSTIAFGKQSAGLVLMPSMVAFRYGTTGIGHVVCTAPAGSTADYATSAGVTSASPVTSATPGISAPDDKMEPWTQVATANNTVGAGWPLNPNLAVIAHYANGIGRGSNPVAERAALEKLCRALRKGNDGISFVFLINNIPDELYAASNFEDLNFVAERASQFKGAIFDVAKSVNGVIVDIDQKWGESAVAKGFLPVNNVHPTGTGATTGDGHYDIAQSIFSIL